jgi:hypothetical protein
LAFFEKNNKIIQWIYSNILSTKFDNRIEMLKKIIPANGVYAELGVFDGAFSKEIIDALNPKKTKNKWDFDVKRAVDQFCIRHQLCINAKALDGCVSYGIQIVGKQL